VVRKTDATKWPHFHVIVTRKDGSRYFLETFASKKLAYRLRRKAARQLEDVQAVDVEEDRGPVPLFDLQ
jgi:hypothetical protein